MGFCFRRSPSSPQNTEFFQIYNEVQQPKSDRHFNISWRRSDYCIWPHGGITAWKEEAHFSDAAILFLEILGKHRIFFAYCRLEMILPRRWQHGMSHWVEKQGDELKLTRRVLRNATLILLLIVPFESTFERLVVPLVTWTTIDWG